MKMASAQRP